MARKRFVSIRQEARNQSVTEDGASDASVNYLASQYLADSSLSVDVTRFDFHASVQASVGDNLCDIHASVGDNMGDTYASVDDNLYDVYASVGDNLCHYLQTVPDYL